MAATAGISGCGGGGGGGGTSPLPNQAPTAAAKLSGEAVANAATVFDTTGTVDADSSIASRSWAYGDGSAGSADQHVYTAPGSYTATLTVTDNLGASASKSLTVTVAKCSAAGLAAAVLSPYTTTCMQTSLGELVLELYPSLAPITVANFLKYVDDGFFTGVLFHRVVPGFVVQAGGYTTGLVAKPATYPAIPLESNNGLKNTRYTLAMAQVPGQPNSATSQFFINLDNNPGLDVGSAANPQGYAVFGQVLVTGTGSSSGTGVVDAIGAVATHSAGGLSDVPVQDVVIRGVVRLP